ncbi:hypothetical protein [Streptomyces sp. NRRL S-920]|uniref:hypothetical protein n=1 Tax=Streptomyces sp. NRRL S-920 TaxID=1463921 RepID=UPI0006910016|nr:hypothetical protein [Streptomyces sp. NRRL S-920]
MPQRVGINVRLGEEFRRTANALREVDRSLPGKLRKDMERALRPAVADAKARVRSLPVQGTSGHTGLRRRVARGVRIQARTGKSPILRVTTSMAERDEQNLPGYLDRPQGWRHPVFGNRHEWVTQHTGGSWFREPLADHRQEIAQSLRQVLDDAAETIAAATRG